jgi:uncharacterized protein with PIN domain
MTVGTEAIPVSRCPRCQEDLVFINRMPEPVTGQETVTFLCLNCSRGYEYEMDKKGHLSPMRQFSNVRLPQ